MVFCALKNATLSVIAPALGLYRVTSDVKLPVCAHDRHDDRRRRAGGGLCAGGCRPGGTCERNEQYR